MLFLNFVKQQNTKDSKHTRTKKTATKNVDEPTGVLAGPKDKEALAKIMAEIEANIEDDVDAAES